ncbi:MAG: hypothetical protein ACK5TN_04020, partial [Acidobacteriota bacterium]
LLFVLAPASKIRAISSLLYRFFFIDLSFHFERSYDFCWYDFRASGQLYTFFLCFNKLGHLLRVESLSLLFTSDGVLIRF